jgi:hypothetical protein
MSAITTLKSRILAFGKTVNKMVAAVQELAIECVKHALAHGDVTVADLLVDTCGKGIKTSALRAWFVATGVFTESDGRFTLNKEGAKELRKLADTELQARLEGMAWIDAKPAKRIVDSVDLSNELDKFIARMDKFIDDEAVACANTELFDAVKVVVARLQAQAILRSTPTLEGIELEAERKYARDHAEVAPVTLAEQKSAERLMHLRIN